MDETKQSGHRLNIHSCVHKMVLFGLWMVIKWTNGCVNKLSTNAHILPDRWNGQ